MRNKKAKKLRKTFMSRKAFRHLREKGPSSTKGKTVIWAPGSPMHQYNEAKKNGNQREQS